MYPMSVICEHSVNTDVDRGSGRQPKKLILCFDGTGNKFRGDNRDSNILKIYRMLDMRASDQYQYYQPGIGTYSIRHYYGTEKLTSRLRTWYRKKRNAAFGNSFDHHVIGGYRFLMRFYKPGDNIYLFGFSRGAFVARFLAEMLDYVGLLSNGNEEMVAFAWRAFARWQKRRHSSGSANGQKESKRLYQFLKNFRETFSQPVKRIRFLGLFDTVNSVPHFEGAWMKRSRVDHRLPYTARSSARVIRHAVAIDERRAKFRHHLLYQDTPRTSRRGKSGPAAAKNARKARLLNKHKLHSSKVRNGPEHPSPLLTNPEPYRAERRASVTINKSAGRLNAPTEGVRRYSVTVSGTGAVPNSWLQAASVASSSKGNFGVGHGLDRGPHQEDTSSTGAKHGCKHARPAPFRLQPTKSKITIVPPLHHNDVTKDDGSVVSYIPPTDAVYDSDDGEQDIGEVWFSGGHVDVGGGWDTLPEENRLSHIPLAWMVREAMKAGLSFDLDQAVELGCMDETDLFAGLRDETFMWSQGQSFTNAGGVPDSPQHDYRSMQATLSSTLAANLASTTSAVGGTDVLQNETVEPTTPWKELMLRAQKAPIHDCLSYSCGQPKLRVILWNMMEYLPFRRMDLQEDGTWRPIRWPLPRGEVRDIPKNAHVHGSVIRRMQSDPTYRPGNLILGISGRGKRVAPPEAGIGEWECVAEKGDLVGELWVRKTAPVVRSKTKVKPNIIVRSIHRVKPRSSTQHPVSAKSPSDELEVTTASAEAREPSTEAKDTSREVARGSQHDRELISEERTAAGAIVFRTIHFQP